MVIISVKIVDAEGKRSQFLLEEIIIINDIGDTGLAGNNPFDLGRVKRVRRCCFH